MCFPGVRLFIAATLSILAPTRQAEAQLGCSGSTCTVEISMPVTNILRLSLASPGIPLGAPTDADYQAGFRDTGPVDVVVKGNYPFTVQLGGMASSFTYAGSFPNPNKPATDLRWALSAGALASTTNHMGTTATLITSNGIGATLPLYLRTLWNFPTDVPGTYSLLISFTLSPP
jgi:hypothetical protein